MRIPKKNELLELQKKYRTDKKIGEVYNVPARLVAYWRSKKKIGSYSFPKYSEEKIHELWERFGDDGRAGEELGITGAGFRQWRRKYNINQKPPQLKLEQLELPLIDINRRKNSRRETFIQKILARRSGLRKVEEGEVINVEPDLVISYDNTAEAIRHFNQIGTDHVWDTTKIIIALDCKSRAENWNGGFAHKAVREFVKKMRLNTFYDIGQGIPHQVILEGGHILPGQLILAADGHAGAYGCIGACSTSIDPLEVAAIWAGGRLWLKVPETIKISVNGHLAHGVYARDIIFKMIQNVGQGIASNKAIEFYGTTIASMPISERFSLTTLASKVGANSAMVFFDDVTTRFLRKTVKTKFAPIAADPDAAYSNEIELDVNYLTPQVASFNDGVIRPIEDILGKRIDQVVLGCCANGRIDDLEIAAKILRGRRIDRNVRMYVIPASRRVYSEALDRGFIRTFMDSGCMILNPSCGSCLDAHHDFLESGENVITTGDCICGDGVAVRNCEIYQASPAAIAASAIEGAIADPRKYVK